MSLVLLSLVCTTFSIVPAAVLGLLADHASSLNSELMVANTSSFRWLSNPIIHKNQFTTNRLKASFYHFLLVITHWQIYWVKSFVLKMERQVAECLNNYQEISVVL